MKKLVQTVNLRPAGLFSNVNEVLYNYYAAEKEGYAIRVRWAANCVYTDQGGDGWPLFFKYADPEGEFESESVLKNNSFDKRNIVTPRLNVDGWTVLLPPLEENRAILEAVIGRHLILRDHIQREIDEMFQREFQGNKVIALHVRGPLRLHGGVEQITRHYGMGRPPYEHYFERVESPASGR